MIDDRSRPRPCQPCDVPVLPAGARHVAVLHRAANLDPRLLDEAVHNESGPGGWPPPGPGDREAEIPAVQTTRERMAPIALPQARTVAWAKSPPTSLGKGEIMPQDRPIVGIDVSKDRLDVHIVPGDRRCSRPNTVEGRRALIADLRRLAPAQIAFEATGGYEQPLCDALLAAGLPMRRCNALQVRRFGQACGTLAKDDPIDAALIARFAGTVSAEIVPPRPEDRRLAELESYRRDIVRCLTRLKAQRDRVSGAVRDLHQRRLKQAEADLREIDARIRQVVRADARLARRHDLISSIPGIGTTLTTTLLACVPEWGAISSRKITALIGVAPYLDRSGRTDNRRHIKAGRRHARSALYMAALCALRYNPVWKAFYDGLVRNGKPGKVALTALMRKIAITINIMIAKEIPWAPPTRPA
ncbi:MAG: IS110 family transposase [Tistrella sp.]|nr:IS110 family transposase [Tistrella sp.]